MFRLSSTDLPTISRTADIPAPLGRLRLPRINPTGVPMARIDYNANRTSGVIPTTVTAAIPPPVGNTYTIQLETELANVNAIVTNGVTFTPALNPDAPQPGEFVFDSTSQTITITT